MGKPLFLGRAEQTAAGYMRTKSISALRRRGRRPGKPLRHGGALCAPSLGNMLTSGRYRLKSRQAACQQKDSEEERPHRARFGPCGGVRFLYERKGGAGRKRPPSGHKPRGAGQVKGAQDFTAEKSPADAVREIRISKGRWLPPNECARLWPKGWPPSAFCLYRRVAHVVPVLDEQSNQPHEHASKSRKSKERFLIVIPWRRRSVKGRTGGMGPVIEKGRLS